MTVEQQARRAEHCRRIAQSGGYATYERYGKWHMSAIGKAGAKATIERHGVAYFKGLPRVNRWGKSAARPSGLAVDLAAGKALARAA